MISLPKMTAKTLALATCALLVACGIDPDAEQNEGAVIDPPAQCSPDRPDCSASADYPVASELDESNSSGIRFSEETGALVIDRVSALPDIDGDGVPDDADDCPGTPDWITCDNDPTNDGLYATVFYDPSGSTEALRRTTLTTVAEIPQIDVYFLIDATPTLAEEIAVLQAEILNIIDDVRLEFEDARFGIGLYRQYPYAPLAAPYSQSPYHHVLDLTDDEALVALALSTLNTVANTSLGSAATQALYSVATGLGLSDTVPNRGGCPNPVDADLGYPCFRADALHVVMNITDAAVYNGPQSPGLEYGDPPFDGTVGAASADLPPAEMFPELFISDSAANALDLGDLSSRSLTLLGMSTALTNQVDTSTAPGCASPPPVPPDPPGVDMDGKDVILALRFDTPPVAFSVFSDNTHWPGAYVALFDDALLDPSTALACDGGTLGNGMWGAIAWNPAPSQVYYVVADGIIPASDPGATPEGAFSISIVHDGDPSNPTWLTTAAPVAWASVESALLASDIRVASVVTLRDAMTSPSDGNLDARLMAIATDAITKGGDQWVTELPAANGEGLDSAVSNTITLASTDSVYDISVTELDDPATPIDERIFIDRIRWDDCAQGQVLECGWGSGRNCRRCDVGAVIDFEVRFLNTNVAPTAASQVFDFELATRADGTVEGERVPVRVMVPDAAAHEFGPGPASAFYQNVYDSTARCITPPERPKWGLLRFDATTPGDTSIDFEIRTAATPEDLVLATPAIVGVPADTGSDDFFDITDALIADGQSYGLPYIQITAVLNASNSPPTSPTLQGWTFEFVCEAAE